MALWKKTTIIIIINFFFLWWYVRTCHTSGMSELAMSELAILRHMDRAMVGFGGTMPPKFFFKNIIKYIDTNFSNFVLENYTFVPLKISLILLRVLL